MTSTTHAAATPDNLLGICHSVGETFGFNPLWLRVLLAIGFIVNFEIAIGTYALLGIAILIGNLIARIARPSATRLAARAVSGPA